MFVPSIINESFGEVIGPLRRSADIGQTRLILGANPLSTTQGPAENWRAALNRCSDIPIPRQPARCFVPPGTPLSRARFNIHLLHARMLHSIFSDFTMPREEYIGQSSPLAVSVPQVSVDNRIGDASKSMIHLMSLPCAAAARAIPPRAARTCSPYRIGIRDDFHLPACMIDAKSILSASRS